MNLQPLPPSLRLVPRTEPALPALPSGRQREVPRLFLITYDNSKRRVRGKVLWDKNEQHESWGTVYPHPHANITLDTGAVFGSMFELRAHFEEAGNYRIAWLEAGELREEEV